MVIKIKDVINGDTAVSYGAGKKCYEKIIDKIDDETDLILDFSGVDYVITAFLNPIIGDLIIEKGVDIMKKIHIENANESIIRKIKTVKDGALIKREDIDE